MTAAYLLHLLDRRARGAAVLARGGRLVCWRRARAGSSCVTPSRLWWLRPLDTRPLLAAAGFTLVRARTVRRGYPSLCVLAER